MTSSTRVRVWRAIVWGIGWVTVAAAAAITLWLLTVPFINAWNNQ